MKLRTRKLRLTHVALRRRLSAEAFTKEVLSPINEHEFPRAGARIARFLRALKEVVELEAEVHAPRDDDWFIVPGTKARGNVVIEYRTTQPAPPISERELRDLKMKLQSKTSEVDRMLSRYHWRPVLVSGGYAFRWPKSTKSLFWENLAVRLLLMSRESGRIRKVRECPTCGKWFFGMTDHQRYCVSSCRQKNASVSLVFKERRRIYMQMYRRSERERDLTAQKLARLGNQRMEQDNAKKR